MGISILLPTEGAGGEGKNRHLAPLKPLLPVIPPAVLRGLTGQPRVTVAAFGMGVMYVL